MLADVLKNYNAREVEAMEVYSAMFRLGEGMIQREGEPPGRYKANPLVYFKSGKGKGEYRILFEDTFQDGLHRAQDADFAILNGITYFGRKNVQAHASKMYAIIFDLDGVTDKSLNNLLHGAFSGYDIYPLPNYIALSGHGVHLYFVFEQPINLYPNIKLQLKELKYALTGRIWNRYTSAERHIQYQGINQGFRPIGGKTKIDGVMVRAFALNPHPWSLEGLGRYVPDKCRVDEQSLFPESRMTIDEAAKRYPKWYQDVVLGGKESGTWTVKRDLYDWWLRRIQTETTFGHRYFAIMCLAIFAAKCGISREELMADAISLIPAFNEINPAEPFLKTDVKSAIECFDPRYCTFPREDIEKLSGINIPPNKRNGRTRAKHLQGARAIRDINNDNWRAGNGRKPKDNIVREWRAAHPCGRKIECERETGLSRHTVLKWWNSLDLLPPT